MLQIPTVWLRHSEHKLVESLQLDGDFSWFVRMCHTRWSATRALKSPPADSQSDDSDGGKSYSQDRARMFIGPRNTWTSPVTDLRVALLERKYGFEFPRVYASFLTHCHRPEFPESRLALTNWHTDNVDDPHDTTTLERGERVSRDARLNRADAEVHEAIATFFARSPNDEVWKRFAISYHAKTLPSCFASAVHSTAGTVAATGAAGDARLFRIPRLIPIANGVKHYYMFERGSGCGAVLAFGIYEGQLHLQVVAPSLHHFLLRFCTEFAIKCQGFKDVRVRDADYDPSWQPVHKSLYVATPEPESELDARPDVQFWSHFMPTRVQLPLALSDGAASAPDPMAAARPVAGAAALDSKTPDQR